MAKYLFVKVKPETLENGEIYIPFPEFIEEIEANAHKAGRGGLTGVNHLRGIVDSIAQKYDPFGMNAFSVRPHMFEGRHYSSNEELNDIVVSMLKQECPDVFFKYVDYHVKHRPQGTKMVYVQDHGIARLHKVLQGYGLDEYIEEKPKKIVGRPAIKDSERAKLKQESETNNQ